MDRSLPEEDSDFKVILRVALLQNVNLFDALVAECHRAQLDLPTLWEDARRFKPFEKMYDQRPISKTLRRGFLDTNAVLYAEAKARAEEESGRKRDAKLTKKYVDKRLRDTPRALQARAARLQGKAARRQKKRP